MAKKTRAERKKQNLRAQNNPNQASKVKEAQVGASSASAEVADAIDESKIAVSDAIEKQERKPAAKAAPVKSDKERARELKEQQKRIERAKKAAKRDDIKKGRVKQRGPKFIWTLVNYIRNVKLEMKRVVWPTRAEVGRMSLIVIIALVFFGVLIFAVDSAVNPVLYALSGLGG